MIRTTVAICTWNRAASLEATLETVQAAQCQMRFPPQVIVVNNNSTDETDSVIDRFMGRMALQPIFEAAEGLSNARNAAVDAATGDYIVWTDDDMLVDPGWLRSYEAAFVADPDAAFFGGPITPVFEGEPPSWLVQAWGAVETAYASRDFGNQQCPFSMTRLPFGGNFAMRSDVQRSYRYDPALGRQPADYWRGGDETFVLRRLLAAGQRGWWVPGASVRHSIPVSRQSTAYLRDYYAGWGRTVMTREPPRPPAAFLRRRIRLQLAWVKWELWFRMMRATRGPEAWVPALVRSSTALGRLRGLSMTRAGQ